MATTYIRIRVCQNANSSATVRIHRDSGGYGYIDMTVFLLPLCSYMTVNQQHLF